MNKATIRSGYGARPTSVPLTGLIIGGLAAVAIGLFLLNWWVFEYGINREGQIRRDSFNFQETAREQVVDLNADLAAIDVQLAEPGVTDGQSAALGAQRIAVADQMCDIAADITGDTSLIVTNIIQEECS